jgi:cobalt-precorrin 5A hydrolase / precorrin-3B C17-methyltransferase
MTAILVLDQGALELAINLKASLAGARVHGLAHRVEGADEVFTEAASHVRRLFQSGEAIIGICATGILVRALAPVLINKQNEPPVIALAADGSVVVPLLGGHSGGNRLAAEIAKACGATNAMTTAGDVRLGVALDDPPKGWSVAGRANAKGIAARLLAGTPVRLDVDCGDADWLTRSDALFDQNASGSRIRVTAEMISGDCEDLILQPPVLTLGIGCERDCEPSELTTLVEDTLAGAGLSAGAVACVVSLDLKMDEPAVHAVAANLGVPARFFTAEELLAETARLANPSDVVFAEVGCYGVSEGAALAAAGEKGALRVEKKRSKRATCAIAFNEVGVDAEAVGRARGRLSIVGIGPGSDAWRTPEASAQLAAASDVVGYGLYLDLVADLIAGKERHVSELAQEEDRVRRALDLAAEGRSVALVCSGDAGIYALATLAFELMDREDRADWNRTEVSVTPGVSALQAAAARIGAPIGHDFCTISLSDLLTPFSEIERRLHAAADGDFVVAFYNPVSKRRRSQLARAQEILVAKRGPDAPVVLARNLGREGEEINVIRLGDLTPDHADMLTMVLVGNSQSRLITRGGRQWVYTPRGYAAKMT